MDISWWRLKKRMEFKTQKKKPVIKRKKEQRERDEHYPSWVNAIMEKY